MKTYQIINWINNSIIYQKQDKSYKDFIENAVKNNIDLSYASFFNEDLKNANLQGGKFEAADFRYCDLTNSNFKNADVSFANFEKSVLNDVDFTGAILTKTNISLYDLYHNIKQMPRDIFSEMFEKQKLLTSTLIKDLSKIDSINERPRLIKDTIQALVDEAHEVLHLIPWKAWKNYKEDDYILENKKEQIKEEVVDLLHFFLQLCLFLNITPDDIYRKYVEKNEVNFNRIKTGYSKGAVDGRDTN